jgi:hypothetical protein
MAKQIDAKAESVSQVLCGLHRQGLASKTFTGGERVSDIILESTGRQFCSTFIDPVNQYLDNGTGPIANQCWSDREIRTYSREAMGIYQKVSPQMNRMAADECMAVIHLALCDVGEAGIRPRHLSTMLRWTPAKTALYLKRMFESGTIQKRKEKNKAFYYVQE